LLPDPVMPTNVAGRYVLPAAGLPNGARIDPALLSPEPVLMDLKPGTVLAAAPAAWTEVLAGLNANRPASLCRDTAELAKITVEAIRCDWTATPAKCAAFFDVKLSDDKLLKELVTPDKLRVAASC
jgi:hypothetical protein